MMKQAFAASLLFLASAPAVSNSDSGSPTPGELVLSGSVADVEAARPKLTNQGFAVREVARAKDKLTIGLTPPKGDEKAVGALFQDLMCGRLTGLHADNVGFVGNEMDPKAKQRSTKYVLYGNPKQLIASRQKQSVEDGWSAPSQSPAMATHSRRWQAHSP